MAGQAVTVLETGELLEAILFPDPPGPHCRSALSTADCAALAQASKSLFAMVTAAVLHRQLDGDVLHSVDDSHALIYVRPLPLLPRHTAQSFSREHTTYVRA